MKNSLLLYIIIILVSCNSNNIKIKESGKWSDFKFVLNNKVLYISMGEDSCMLVETFKEDLTFFKKTGEYRRTELKYIINHERKEKIFRLAEEIITKPIISEQIVSCYAGDYITISLENKTTKIACEYMSTSNWTKISNELKELNEMLILDSKKRQSK